MYSYGNSVQIKLDSLLEVYENGDSNYQKASVYANICYQSLLADHKETLEYCKMALQLSKDSEIDSLSVHNLCRISYKLLQSESVELANPYIEEAIRIAENSSNSYIKLIAYDTYAVQFLRYKNKGEALQLLLKARAISNKIGSKVYLYRLNMGIGLIYYDSNNYEEAFNYFNEALQPACEVGNNEYNILLGYIGFAKKELEEYEIAKNYFLESIDYFSQTNYQLALNRSYKGIAEIDHKLGNYKKSNQYFEKIFSNSNNELLDARDSKLLYAQNFYNLGQYNKALEIYSTLLALLPKIHDYDFTYNLYKNLAFTYDSLQEDELSNEYFKKSLEVLEKTLDSDLRKASEANYLEYELDKSIAENDILKIKGEQKSTKHKLRLYQFLLLILITVALLCLATYAYYIQKRKSGTLIKQKLKQELINKELLESKELQSELNDQLQAKNVELEEFARVAAHDIKSPIRTMGSFIQLLKRRIPEDQRLPNCFHMLIPQLKIFLS